MPEPLFRKLGQFIKLTDDDRRVLSNATQDVRAIGAREDIILEGDRPDVVHLILEGWAGRYKILAGGQRSILAYLIPGDLCDIHVALLTEMDHSIATLSPCRIAFISRSEIATILEANTRLTRALWWATMVDEAILREWLVTVGHRPADKRIAHLFCEMLLRSKAVGLTSDNSFHLPLTQEELGDTMGLSAVHTNRTLGELRNAGLISIDGRRITIPDVDRLKEFAEFNPNYLHQQKGK
jgi:CRP-like cAMP-binding protein